ncbi:unnamed protein product, partial [Didymodactylos carnosus]
FSDLEIHECWFHFTQAIHRRIQKEGLVDLYESNADVKMWLRSYMALPLLLPSTLDDAIKHLNNSIPFSDPKLRNFVQYFETQWVLAVPSEYWSLGPVHLRTNNAIKGNHYFLR